MGYLDVQLLKFESMSSIDFFWTKVWMLGKSLIFNNGALYLLQIYLSRSLHPLTARGFCRFKIVALYWAYHIYNEVTWPYVALLD